MVKKHSLRVVRTRPESFGAFVLTDRPPAVVAVNRALAKHLGVDGRQMWDTVPELPRDTQLSGPIEVHLAVTSLCFANCKDCYVDARLDGQHLAFDAVRQQLETARKSGAFTVAIGGAEPALHPRIGDIASLASDLGLVPTLTTSGIGVAREHLDRLHGFAQVNVSYDGAGAAYESVRGFDGTRHSLRMFRELQDRGIRMGANTVLTRQNFSCLADTQATLTEYGVAEWQWLRLKPAGRGEKTYLAERLLPEQAKSFVDVLAAAVSSKLSIRVDCALVPFFSLSTISETELSRFGILGCTAAERLLAVDPMLQVRPCSVWRDRPGEALTEHTWTEDTALTSVRDFARELPEPCGTCRLAKVCRGGCRVVASFLSGSAFVPDPECPKVVGHLQPRTSPA